ncbi:MAG: hypothetical protein EHM72_15285 [Calditrichaeota bacterium]|nr:MAG: hypothetical protein EHM72_15285 [Calditrichota bacterium]
MFNYIIQISLALMPPIAGFLLFWWSSIPLLPEKAIPYAALSGLALGITIDIIFLKRWNKKAYYFHPLIWMGIYIFYSIGVFGFFMGFPLFNALLAVPAGLITADRLLQDMANTQVLQTTIRKTATFTSAVLLFFCVVSAVIFFIDPYVRQELSHLLGLKTVPSDLFWAISVSIGGLTLVIAEYAITQKTVLWALARQSRGTRKSSE